MYYAQLDAESVVIGVAELNGEVDADNLIPLDHYDIRLIGTTHNGESFVEKYDNEKAVSNTPFSDPLALVQENQKMLMEAMIILLEEKNSQDATIMAQKLSSAAP